MKKYPHKKCYFRRLTMLFCKECQGYIECQMARSGDYSGRK